MSVAQALALRFELAHAAKNCLDQRKRADLLQKIAALEEKLKAGHFKPSDYRKVRT